MAVTNGVNLVNVVAHEIVLGTPLPPLRYRRSQLLKTRESSGVQPLACPRLQTIQLGVEAQSVIALRMMRLAAGGARGRAEATRMVAEKVGALAEAQTAAAAAILTGRRQKVVAGKILTAYKKRVGANRRRLSRR
jgi:hypothetical protein